MRKRNLALVLGTVAAHGPLSRAAVAAHTGLTRAAVSSLVDELRAAALLDEAGPTAPSGRAGRPGTALALSATGPAGLGLEVGVEHIAGCVVDLRGEVRAEERVECANRGREAEAVLPELALLAKRLTDRAQSAGLSPAGTVLAVPGLVPAPADGVVEHAPNLGWRRVPAGKLLAELLDEQLAPAVRQRPLTVENEANLGALAELWAGRGAGLADFVHVSAEAGIGAALVVDGRLLRGARGFAGELGHVPVYPQGPVCVCGARGCLEQYAGEAAVLAHAGIDVPADRPGDRIALLAEGAGDGGGADGARVRAALRRAGEALGIALAGAVNLIDPAAVLLGGAYAELGEWLLPGLRRELGARVAVRVAAGPPPPAEWAAEAVTVSGLGRAGAVRGAALATVRRVLDDPADAAF
jgi:predicted NBD/HSP70 family sugar kinase